MIDLSPFRCEEGRWLFKPKETERVFAIDFLWGIEFVSSRSAKDMTSKIPRSGNDAVPFLGGNRQFVSLKVGIFALRRQQKNER